MNIQKIKITELKPAKYNPRKDLKPEDEEYQKIKKKLSFSHPFWQKGWGFFV